VQHLRKANHRRGCKIKSIRRMSYQKFKGSYLFTGFELLPGDTVLVTDAAGTVVDMVPQTEAGEDIQAFEGILTPGFINTHCHLELSHLKGAIAENTGLIHFLIAVPQLRNYPAEVVQQAIAAAEQEMYQSGIVAVGDICNTADTIPVKQKSSLLWHNFIETIGFSNEKALERFTQAQAVYQQFESAHPGHNTMVPHAPYTASEALFGLLNESAAGNICTIHNQECAAENELYQTKTGDYFKLYRHFGIDTDFFTPSGKTSLQTYLPWLNKPRHLLLVHNVAITQADIALLTNQLINQLTYFPLCPNANQYIERQIPPIGLLQQNGCTITLGTDSLASNYQLSILEETKTILRTHHTVSTTEVLGWATINGAKALQMDNVLGSFEKGKKPGIVLIEGAENGEIGEKSVSKRLL
jgi:aminodeoxyfutalosine deaminase